jgi:hypothetical protein
VGCCGFLTSMMMCAIFMPARSLPPGGFALGRSAGALLPRRSVAVCAARRPWPREGADVRPSISSILRTLNAGQASVLQVMMGSPFHNLCSAFFQCFILMLHPPTLLFQVLESQSPFLKSSDGLLLLEALGKQNNWPLTLVVLIFFFFFFFFFLLHSLLLVCISCDFDKIRYVWIRFQVFRWMQKQKWYKHDDGFYSKLIVIMGKAKQLRNAVWLFNEVKRTGSRPDTSLYNALITAYLSSKDKGRGFEKALQLFEAMKKKAKYVCFAFLRIVL